MDGSPFGYAGLQMQEALSKIQTSLVAKTGTPLSYDMDAVSQAQEWWEHQSDGEAQLQARFRGVPSAFWRRVRQETRQCHQEQLNRFRFRHWPLESLASVEMRWEQTTGTGVLPP